MTACCDTPTLSATIISDDLVAGDHVQTTNVLPTAGQEYKRGDLLVLSAANVATLAIDPAAWDVIATHSLTPAQATSQAAAGVAFAAYNQGEFRLSRITLGGAPLTPAQYDAAMARGSKQKIELRKAA